MKFSIIVPVYNVQQYLCECVDSILKQNFKNYELLLVDDGSTDASSSICDDYARHNQFVRVFHKQNGGLSDARNYGMQRANGDYLIFIDSDDYISDGCLEKFNDTLSFETDVLITRLTQVFPEKTINKDDDILKIVGQNLNRQQAIKWIMSDSQNTWPAQKYIVSRSFINDNNITFKKNFLHEDVDWTCRLCLYGKRFLADDHLWYFHRMNRTGSITSTKKPKNVIDVIEIAYDLIIGKDASIINQELSIVEKKQVVDRLMRSVYPSIACSKFMKEEDRKLIAVEIEKRIDLFEYSPNFKYRLFSSVIKYAGAQNAISLLALI